LIEEKVPLDNKSVFRDIDPKNLTEQDKKMIRERDEGQSQGYKSCLSCYGCIPQVCCVICAPCGCGPIKIVQEGQCGLIKELGRYVKKVGPGVHA